MEGGGIRVSYSKAVDSTSVDYLVNVFQQSSLQGRLYVNHPIIPKRKTAADVGVLYSSISYGLVLLLTSRADSDTLSESINAEIRARMTSRKIRGFTAPRVLEVRLISAEDGRLLESTSGRILDVNLLQSILESSEGRSLGPEAYAETVSLLDRLAEDGINDVQPRSNELRTKLVRWFFFGVLAAVLPLLTTTVSRFTRTEPLTLIDLFGRGELILISVALALTAAGEALVVPRVERTLLASTFGSICVVLAALAALVYGDLSRTVVNDVRISGTPDPGRLSIVSLAVFLIVFAIGTLAVYFSESKAKIDDD